MTVTIPRRLADTGLFAVFLILAGLAFWHTATFPEPLLRGYPGSAMFPRLVLATMAVLCLLGIARRLFLPAAAGQDRPLTLPIGGFARAIALASGYVAIFAALGVEIATFAATAGAIWLQCRRLVPAIVAGVLSVVVVYFVFVQLLSVHLPLAFLPRYLG